MNALSALAPLAPLAPFTPVVLVAALLVLRQPLMLILLALAALVHLQWGQGRLEYIAEDLWIALDKELILSIPMFMLCGQVMTRGSAAQRLIRIMRALTPRIPGGLAVACTLSCALDASISGSSIVTMLAIGTVMVPSLLQAGYDRRFSLGAVMSGGTLGIIIPPSIPMILYALVTETSVVELFKAGIGPGLLLTATFVTYAMWKNRHMPTAPFDRREFGAALREGLWALMLPVILLGGIYSGLFSTTEAAAVALAYAVAIELFVHKALAPRELYATVLEAARFGGALFPVIAVALSLSLVLTEHRVPTTLVQLVQAHIDSPLAFMVAMNLLLLAVGCVMTTDAAILVLAPLLAPIAAAYGYDKVLFGIVMILNLEIAYLTPPVGLNLIVAMGAFKQPFGLLCRAALPFIGMMLGCLALVIWQPWIAMGLVR
ncbi:MAG: TRAP transporter large permease subunit [Rubrivivax sp.]|nr:TRAP transporter large permease subunit [Rubrivivax sp.]